MKSIFLWLTLLAAFNLYSQKISVDDRIAKVENSLMPYVPVNGLEQWNIYERMKHYKVPGVSIAVINNYKIEWAKGYGLADTIKKIPVTTETIFSAGSISKLLSATIAMQLVEEGKLELNQPIKQFLTSWKITENDNYQKNPVTLRMLLSHTGGTSQSSYFGFTPDRKPLPTITQILNGEPTAESNRVVVNSEPGKQFQYSGGGSMIVQMAMMDVTGKDFTTLTQQRIFDKLKMNNSTFEQPLPKPFQSKVAWGYSSASWYKGMPYVYPQQAAAGLHTTPTDLARFILDLQLSSKNKGKLISQKSFETMMNPVIGISSGGYKEEMGLGAFLLQRADNKEETGRYFEHQGANAGFISFAIGNISEGYGAVIMMNSGDDFNGLGTEIRRAIAATYQWKNFLPEAITLKSLDGNTLKSYEGRYRKGVDEVVTIKLEKNYLLETINGGNAIYCIPTDKDQIVFTDYNVKGRFVRDETENVIGLQTEWQSEPMPKMKSEEFSPSELLSFKQYEEAKVGLRQMKMNEYQITYYAYNWLNKKPKDLNTVKAILEVALEQHPNASIVYARWGEYYQACNDKNNARLNYQKALELEPSNKEYQIILEKI
ncbi:serine hydrolase [Flavobacterium sp.]|uniref:serine hydrolase n=1 Tax=Flavobacterium sp. TaxID=239 RepID=UPI00391B5C39